MTSTLCLLTMALGTAQYEPYWQLPPRPVQPGYYPAMASPRPRRHATQDTESVPIYHVAPASSGRFTLFRRPLFPRLRQRMSATTWSSRQQQTSYYQQTSAARPSYSASKIVSSHANAQSSYNPSTTVTFKSSPKPRQRQESEWVATQHIESADPTPAPNAKPALTKPYVTIGKVRAVAEEGSLSQTQRKPGFRLLLRKGFEEKVGHETDYSWITGQIYHLNNMWILRYAMDHEVDRYGGYVILSTAANMSRLHTGDLVSVQGSMLASGNFQQHRGLPIYRATHIYLLER